jgi:hypothetical protein
MEVVDCMRPAQAGAHAMMQLAFAAVPSSNRVIANRVEEAICCTGGDVCWEAAGHLWCTQATCYCPLLFLLPQQSVPQDHCELLCELPSPVGFLVSFTVSSTVGFRGGQGGTPLLGSLARCLSVVGLSLQGAA